MDRDALAEALMRATAMFEEHPSVQMQVDRGGIISRVNRAAREMFGVDIHQQQVDTLFEKGFFDQLIEMRQRSGSTGGPFSSGGLNWHGVSLDDGFLVVLQPSPVVTRSKTSSPLSALALVAGAAAHEMNNPLAAISFRLEMMEQDASMTDAVQVHLDKLVGQVQRLATSVRSLQFLAGGSVSSIAQFSVDEVCGEVAQRVRPLLKGVPIRVDVVDMGDVCGSPDQVEHAITVLLLHVVTRTPSPSEVVIRARALDGRVRLTLGASSRGQGLTASHASDAMQGSGAAVDGLGVQVVRGVAEKHGGELEMGRSALGVLWASFSLPLVPSSPDSGVPDGISETPKPPIRLSLRVLVVEDESDLSRLIGWLLSSAGHIGTFVSTAEAALELLTDSDSFDVILCDVRLPGLTGLDLLADLVNTDHPLAGRVVLMSGFVRPESVEVNYLPKPFTREALMSALQAAARS